jgi:hypothetical protein
VVHDPEIADPRCTIDERTPCVAHFVKCSTASRERAQLDSRSSVVKISPPEQILGGVAEWSKAAVLKTAVPKGTRGSNPFSSALVTPGSSQFVVGARKKFSEHTRLGAAVDSFGRIDNRKLCV